MDNCIKITLISQPKTAEGCGRWDKGGVARLGKHGYAFQSLGHATLARIDLSGNHGTDVHSFEMICS